MRKKIFNYTKEELEYYEAVSEMERFFADHREKVEPKPWVVKWQAVKVIEVGQLALL